MFGSLVLNIFIVEKDVKWFVLESGFRAGEIIDSNGSIKSDESATELHVRNDFPAPAEESARSYLR
jgi:hypothetical protein